MVELQKNPITKKIIKVAPANVGVDIRVQRPRDDRRIKALAAEFNPLALGVPTVSVRQDGTMIWLDGQTRGGALILLGLGSQPIDATSYKGLRLNEEAEIFRILNNTKKLSPVDLYRIAIIEKDPIAVDSNAALNIAGWTAEASTMKSWRAVNTLYNAWEKDAPAVKMALMVIAKAWGPSRQSGDVRIFSGVFAFCSRYLQQLDAADLSTRLAKEKGGAVAFISRVRTLAELRTISVPDAGADILTGIYNKGRKGGLNTVPQWDTVSK